MTPKIYVILYPTSPFETQQPSAPDFFCPRKQKASYSTLLHTARSNTILSNIYLLVRYISLKF